VQASNLTRRLAVFVKFAEELKGNLGRTSLMKLCYFLQTVRDVPLQYSFSLYSYGPFDSEILSDLQMAENMNILEAEVEYYPGGYKYDIRTSEKSGKLVEIEKDFLAKYKKDIEWATQLFGNRSAAELELLSTILFVYEEEQIKNEPKLAERVNSIKPHFTLDQIGGQIGWLKKNLLLS
jgi:uncharacterized protein